jgi:hypothetical protein
MTPQSRVKNSHFLDFVEAGRNPGNLEVRFAPIAAISAKVASWPDEAASLFRGEMSDRPRVRQCPALI